MTKKALKISKVSLKNIDAFVNALSRFKNIYEKSRLASNKELGYEKNYLCVSWYFINS